MLAYVWILFVIVYAKKAKYNFMRIPSNLISSFMKDIILQVKVNSDEDDHDKFLRACHTPHATKVMI